MNKRGEIVTATVVVIAACAFVGGLLLTKLNPFKAFNSSVPQQKQAWVKQKETITPTYTVKNGIVNKIEREYDSGTSETERKLTLNERIGQFISNLSLWSLGLIGISLLFFGGTPIVWALKKYQTVKQALKSTVSAIKEADDETYNKLKPKLEAKHDVRDRKVIDKIKGELHQ